MPVYKNGTRVAPPVLTAPTEVMIRVDGDLNPVIVKIEYDKAGLHFFNQWGMCSLTEEVIENAESDTALPELHD